MPIDDDGFYTPPELRIVDPLRSQVVFLLQGDRHPEERGGFLLLRNCVYLLGMNGQRGKWYTASVDVHSNLLDAVKGEEPDIAAVVKALDGLVASVNEINKGMVEDEVGGRADDKDRRMVETVVARNKVAEDIRATYQMLNRLYGAKIESPPEVKKLHSKYLTKMMLGMGSDRRPPNGGPGGRGA